MKVRIRPAGSRFGLVFGLSQETTEILGTPWLRRNKVIPSNVEQVKGAAQLDATVGHILADGLLHGGDSTS